MVQLLVIYLCTNMRCYFKNRLQKSLLPLLDSAYNNTIHNILLRFLRMFLKFAALTLRLYLQRDNIGLLNEKLQL